MTKPNGTTGTKAKKEIRDNPCCTFDFRISKKDTTAEHIKTALRNISKHWVFQEEKGEKTGYEHYQGRFSLKIKARKDSLLGKCKTLNFVPNYLEKTSKENSKNDFYVTKDDTRVSGPWKDTDKEVFIPKKYENAFNNMFPYQKNIYDSKDTYDDRTINMIYDNQGNIGKSTIGMICELYGKGEFLPPLTDAKELVQTLCDICMAKEERSPSPIIIDLPRAMQKDKMFGLFSAIEQIKNGKLYDIRYKYKSWMINPPQIWVFSNKLPDENLLSNDRWKIWTINDKKELVKYEPENHLNNYLDN